MTRKATERGRLAARLHQGIDTRDPCNCGRSRHRRLPIRLRPSERTKARGSSRRRGRMVSSPTRFPRREKSSGRAAATAALLPAPSSATS